MPGRSARRKGYEFEREVVRELQGLGIDAKRVPLSGAVRGFEGDIILPGGLLVECKRRKRLPAYMNLKAVTITRSDRGEMVIAFRLSDFAAFMNSVTSSRT